MPSLPLTPAENAAIAEFRQTIKGWASTRNSREVGLNDKQHYLPDRKDMRNVIRLFRAKKFNEAMKAARHLDTIVRDQIPNSFWDALNNHVPESERIFYIT